MKLLLFALLTIGCVTVQAQVQPNWVDVASREMQYPYDTYIVGHVVGEIVEGESLDSAISRLKNDARVEAASSISVSISGSTSQRLHNLVIERNNISQEFVQEEYSSSNAVSTKIDNLPGLTVETWRRPKSNVIEAFAWAKRVDVITKLQRQLTMSIAKIELRVQEAHDFIAKGDKSSAKQIVKNLFALFAPIEHNQKCLICIDSTLSDDDIMLNESSELQKLVTTMYNELKSGISVYIDYQPQTLVDNENLLLKEPQNKLIAKEFSFAQTPDSADWVVSIRGNMREHGTSQSSIYKICVVYVEAQLEIVQRKDNRKIYSNTLTAKGVHTSDMKGAMAAACKNIGKQIGQIVEEHIN